MTDPKRGRGRPPKVGLRFDQQKHFFLDRETADRLAILAARQGVPESAVIRALINAEYERTAKV